MTKPILLGSSSPYRRELLGRLGVEFRWAAPNLDEKTITQTDLAAGCFPLQIAQNLSSAKAETLFAQNPNSLVIAGDQLVEFNGQIIGKPGNFEKAHTQLSHMSGNEHQLITAVTLKSSDLTLNYANVTTLKMKALSPAEIAAYLHKDQPYDCAGSYKIELGGIALFEKIECDDFTAIQGLPLIWLSNRLKEMGYEFFKS